MLSKLCCDLGNLFGLIGRERSSKESEPLHANSDLEGHESLGRRYCTTGSFSNDDGDGK